MMKVKSVKSEDRSLSPTCRLQCSSFVLFALLGLVGCAQTIPLGGGKKLEFISRADEKTFLRKQGFPDNGSAAVSHSRTGDRLFIQWDDHANAYNAAVKYKVAIVSSDRIVLKDLPGDSCLNDRGEPICWLTWQDKTSTIHFANGYTLATNEHWVGRSDGKFIPMFREHEDHWWVAPVESPFREIVTFDWEREFQFLISDGEILHVFVRGKPEGAPRPDGWFILKHYEYRVDRNMARLLRVQDFPFTWNIWDFDPQSSLMLARSWDTMFAHGLLVDTITGKHKDLRGINGSGCFLQNDVAMRFRQTVQDP